MTGTVSGCIYDRMGIGAGRAPPIIDCGMLIGADQQACLHECKFKGIPADQSMNPSVKACQSHLLPDLGEKEV